MAYIDNRLTTGLNDGSSEINAFWSITDWKAGPNILAGATVDFVAGSGPYSEFFGRSDEDLRQTEWLTDVTINVGTGVYSSSQVDFASKNFNVGDWVYFAELDYPGLYLLSAVAVGSVTVNASTPFNPSESTNHTGSRLKISLSTGTGPQSNIFPMRGQGTFANPITVNMNGVALSALVDIGVGSPYIWTASAKTDEYYLTKTDGTDPGFATGALLSSTNGYIIVNGFHCNYSAASVEYPEGNIGIAGSLTTNKQCGLGDYTSEAGFSTIYIKWDAGSPSGEDIRTPVTTYGMLFGLNPDHWTINMGGGKINGGQVGIACLPTDDATAYQFKVMNGFIEWSGGSGVDFNDGFDGTAVFENVFTYWCGHNGFNQGGSSVSATLKVDHCADYGSHLGARLGRANATLEFINGVISGGEAGAVNYNDATAVLTENNNGFYPKFTDPDGAVSIGYLNSYANGWTATNATDIPASEDTRLDDNATLLAPQYLNPSDYGLVESDYLLLASSPYAEAGVVSSVTTDMYGNTYPIPSPLGPFALFAASGSPTLTTPYPLGTNNGPLFTSTSSDTIATVEGAGFLNDLPGWASLLKTGDVVIIECSNGTKMYTVTVDVQARIITLSTGLLIA